MLARLSLVLSMMVLLVISVATVAVAVSLNATGATAGRNEHLHVPLSLRIARDAGTRLCAYIKHDEHHMAATGAQFAGPTAVQYE